MPKTEMNDFILEGGGAAALAAAIIGLKLLDGAAATEAVALGLAPALFVSIKVISPSVCQRLATPTAGRGLSMSRPRHAHHLNEGNYITGPSERQVRGGRRRSGEGRTRHRYPRWPRLRPPHWCEPYSQSVAVRGPHRGAHWVKSVSH